MSKKLTQSDIADIMADIDICMMTTLAQDGKLESRPMSNNRDVRFDGDCYFFTHADTDVVKQLALKHEVNLSYVGSHSLFGLKKVYLSLAGEADMTTDRAIQEKHWVPDLEAWFSEGLDTPGLTLIHVQARTVQYWDGMDGGVVSYNRARKLAA